MSIFYRKSEPFSTEYCLQSKCNNPGDNVCKILTRSSSDRHGHKFMTSGHNSMTFHDAVVSLKMIMACMVQLQCLVHLWNHANMFETGVVRADECLSQRQVRRLNNDIFSNFYNTKVCCVFSLESPHRGDSNECTQYTIFNV